MSVMLFAVCIVIAFVMYSRKKSGHRTKAQEIADLVAQQMKAFDEKIASLSPSERLCIPIFLMGLEESKAKNPGDQTVIAVMDNLREKILDKYNSYILPDEAFYENGEMLIWNERPGCFERHLQRRYKNILFPLERRVVSKNDIFAAREKDEFEQRTFIETVKYIGAEMDRLASTAPELTLSDSSYVQKIQALLKQAASIGGNIQNAIQLLETAEKRMIEGMIKLRPDLKDEFKTVESCSYIERNAFMAQSSRADTPILPEEIVASLLCEDLETIALWGHASRAFAPKFKPNEKDITKHLDEAVHNGFSKDQANEIIDTWNYNR